MIFSKMNYKSAFLSICLLLMISYHGYSQHMNNEKLGSIITTVGDSINHSSEGVWEFKYLDRYMIVITDQNNNRMRIITPIVKADKVKRKIIDECMKANFDRALDVKYAISNDIIWSVFAHPLRELSENQAKDAILQVYTAAKNFGSTFTSTHLVFGGGNKKQ